MWNALLPVLLLIGSNVFMTFAWYGHLKFTDRPLWLVIVASWGIAFFEYCLQVPANRYGYAVFNPAQLKAMQACSWCSRCSTSAPRSSGTMSRVSR